MRASPFGYQFTIDARGSFMPHETLDLQLLELVNRGTRLHGRTIRLRRAPPRINQTIQDLATDRYRFAAAGINIEGNHLALNFGKQIDTTQCPIECRTDHGISVVRTYPLTAMMSFDEDTGPRAHTCISRKIYAQFAADDLTSPAENSDGDDNGILPSSDDEVGPIPVSSSSIRSVQLRRPSRVTASRSQAQSTSTSDSTSAPSRLQRTQSLSSFNFLPASIWKNRWVPPVGRYFGLYAASNMAEDVFEAATSGIPVDDLEVRGLSVDELADTFSNLLAEAAKEGDFTDVLSPKRRFYVYVILLIC